MGESTLSNLLTETRRFPPPPGIAAHANVTADVYDRAAADRLDFWDEQARRLSWAQPWHTALQWDAPFAKWLTTEAESALVSHLAVAEAAVVGATDPITGQGIVAFVILRGSVPEEEAEGWALAAQLRDHVAKTLAPIAKPRQILVVPELPKTRSANPSFTDEGHLQSNLSTEGALHPRGFRRSGTFSQIHDYR